MINLEKANNEFKEYIKKYNPNDPKIELKIAHMKRVEEIAGKIAQDLNLSEEDVLLAKLIGLLHDIGRFEQIKRYNTFNDKKSVNHGEFGVKILFEDNLIKEFIENRKFDNIIKKAVLNHNRNEIEEGLNERELLHSKIIRDADKIDIFDIIVKGDTKVTYESEALEDEKFTPEIVREFVNYEKIDYSKKTTHADTLICHYRYIFDLNFPKSIEFIKEKEYLEKLYNKIHFSDIKTQEQFDLVYKISKEYIEEKAGCLK